MQAAASRRPREVVQRAGAARSRRAVVGGRKRACGLRTIPGDKQTAAAVVMALGGRMGEEEGGRGEVMLVCLRRSRSSSGSSA